MAGMHWLSMKKCLTGSKYCLLFVLCNANHQSRGRSASGSSSAVYVAHLLILFRPFPVHTGNAHGGDKWDNATIGMSTKIYRYMVGV